VTTPDGEHAYVTNRGNNTVSVITTATDVISATIPVGTDPNGVTITPDGEHVCDQRRRRRSVISTADECGIGHLPVGPGPSGLTITPDGKYAYLAAGYGTASVITTATNAVSPITTATGGVAICPARTAH
jgi:YVTN family beta-propeller protein